MLGSPPFTPPRGGWLIDNVAGTTGVISQEPEPHSFLSQVI